MHRRLRLIARRVAAGVLLRQDRWGVVVHVALLLAGVGLGLLVALPVGDVRDRCPPSGEGFAFCAVQKAWAPLVLLVLSGGLLGQWLAGQLLVRLPAWRALRREVGERRVGEDETREEPPYARDPFLLASTWGAKHGRSERRRPSVGEILARLRRR